MLSKFFNLFQKNKNNEEIHKLKEEINLLKTIFWNLPHVAFVRNNKGEFILVNKKFASNFKLQNMEEILGKTDFDFNPNPEQVQKIQSQDKEIMNSKKIFHVPKNKYLDKQGKATYLETIKAPIIINDESKQILGFSIDITEKAELELRAEEALTTLYSTLTYVDEKIKEITNKANQINENTKKQSNNLEFLTNLSYIILESNASSISMISNVWKIVNEANISAEDGNIHLEKILESMTNIKENSEKMLGIVELIQSIADQTNLLSLNASIEAARAGVHGRGFAVVAHEVSKLAEESASNTKGIRNLVKFTDNKIKLGNENVSKGVETFKKIISEVDQIEVLIEELNEMMKNQTEQYSSFNEKIEDLNSEANQIEEKTEFQKNTLIEIQVLIEKLNSDFKKLLAK